MSPIQKQALDSFGDAGAIHTRLGWTWKEDVRQSEDAARAILEGRAAVSKLRSDKDSVLGAALLAVSLTDFLRAKAAQ